MKKSANPFFFHKDISLVKKNYLTEPTVYEIKIEMLFRVVGNA